jgi:hypothetical protein
VPCANTHGTLLIGVVAGEWESGDDDDDDSRASDYRYAVTLGGHARVRVIGPIRPGDLLVASHVPGYARASDGIPAPGTIVGKALRAHAVDDRAALGSIEALITVG